MLHIKKDDQVLVLVSNPKHRRGRVLRVFPATNQAVVEGFNLIKRHTRPNPQRNIKGGIVEREGPIELSNLKVICRECDLAVRVGFTKLSDGKKVRVCRRCGGTIDK